ncbi:MAG: GreA/GreB family elongation factor, partial [Oscillospiraceae bacterium]
ITGSTEANPVEGKISNESPVGAALMGKKLGEEVDITLPNGSLAHYKVLDISKTLIK